MADNLLLMRTTIRTPDGTLLTNRVVTLTENGSPARVYASQNSTTPMPPEDIRTDGAGIMTVWAPYGRVFDAVVYGANTKEVLGARYDLQPVDYGDFVGGGNGGGDPPSFAALTGLPNDNTALASALSGKAAAVHGHSIADVSALQGTLDAKSDVGHAHAIADVTGLQTSLDSKAAVTHSHVVADVTGLQTALDGKASASHTHTIANVTGLQAALDSKAATLHSHVISDVTGLQAAIDAKAPAIHTHAISDVTGLQGQLDSKAAASHTHAITDVTGLQTALNGKAATSHTHVISDVTGLQTAIDSKAAATHSHIIGDVTGLQTALDGKAAASHSHSISDITSLQTTLNGKVNLSTFVTKGDLMVATGAAVVTRVGVGADGQILTADSTQSAGVKWADPPAGGGIVSDATTTSKGIVQLAGDLSGTASAPTVPNMISKILLTAKGSIAAASAANTPAELTVGTNGQVLSAASAQTTGLQWITLTKTSVGLSNVDNTADTAKPVSTAQQAALDLKIDKSALSAKGALVTATAANTPSTLNVGANGQVIVADAAQLSGIKWYTLTKSDIGLSNVDNTSDANKPVSTAQQTALDGKIDKTTLTAKGSLVSATGAGVPANVGVGTDGQVLSALASQSTGLSWKTLAKADVGLSNVDNTSDANKPISSATQTALNGKVNTSQLSAKGALVSATAANTPTTVTVGTDGQVLYADSTQTPGMRWKTLTKSDVGLANVDNTSDANKPISTATATALAGKSDTSHSHTLLSLNAFGIPVGWNAAINTPTLVSSTPPASGNTVFRVTNAGNTTLDGNTNWIVDDIAYFDTGTGVFRKMSVDTVDQVVFTSLGTGGYNGHVKRVIDIGNYPFVELQWETANTRWVPRDGRQLIYCADPITTASGNTQTISLPSFTIPGGLLGSILGLEIEWEVEVNGQTPTSRVAILTYGSTNFVDETGLGLTNRLMGRRCGFKNMGAANVQRAFVRKDTTSGTLDWAISGNNNTTQMAENSAANLVLSGSFVSQTSVAATATMLRYNVYLVR